MGTKIRVIYEKISYLFCFLWYFFIFLSQNAKFKVGKYSSRLVFYDLTNIKAWLFSEKQKKQQK